MEGRSAVAVKENQIAIRLMKDEDCHAVLDIYQKGIETRNATFETQPPTWVEWEHNHLLHSRFVVEQSDEILGWSALSPYSKREVYRGVAELSIYIDPRYAGKGIGSKLMEVTIHSAKENGCWTLQSGVFPENKASLALHKKFGFREVGYRERIGQLDGIWRDVILLEKRF